MTLTKEHLLGLFKDELGFSTKDSKSILEILLEELKNKLEEGDEIKISNFGKWTVRQKNNRLGRNPNNGLPIEISARSVVTFRPSERLRNDMNLGKSQLLV